MADPLPYRQAIAHAAGACAIVALVALSWRYMAGAQDATFALATVAVIGVLAWIGAAVAAGPPPATAANDNHPFDPLYLTWTPIEDRLATVQPVRR